MVRSAFSDDYRQTSSPARSAAADPHCQKTIIQSTGNEIEEIRQARERHALPVLAE